MSNVASIPELEEYNEEKAMKVFESFKNKESEYPVFSSEWYREKYPGFPDMYYEAFEKFSNESVTETDKQETDK